MILFLVAVAEFEGLESILRDVDEQVLALGVLGVDSPDEEVKVGWAAIHDLGEEEEFGLDVLVFLLAAGGVFGYVVAEVTEEGEDVSIEPGVVGVFAAVHDEAAAGFHADAVDFFQVFGGACLEVESAVGEFEAGSGFMVVAADAKFFHLVCEPVGVCGGEGCMYVSEHAEGGLLWE